MMTPSYSVRLVFFGFCNRRIMPNHKFIHLFF